MRALQIRAAVVVALMLQIIGSAAAAESADYLWQVGAPDGKFDEYALAPNRYNQYRQDGFCVIGQFDAKKDWPYFQPGPADVWAGGKVHTSSIVFGLKQAPSDGQCRLVVKLVDTHWGNPPELRIDVNGKSYRHRTPRGGGDDSINGKAAAGKPHAFEVAFPANLLRQGPNDISIATMSGSWILFDWIGLQAPAGLELTQVNGTVVHSINAIPALVEKDGKLSQPIQIGLRHFGDDAQASVSVTGAQPLSVSLKKGTQTIQALVPAVEKETGVTIAVEAAGKTIASRQQTLQPVRKWVLYLLPHSHVDIGYTHVQTDVEKRQWDHLEVALEACRRTANYPDGARFKWNVEVLWAVDSYLNQAPPQKQQALIEAIRAGQVGLQALYGNELTALCRPEELVRLVTASQRIARRCGVTIDNAMISDVPGYTWGIVPVFAQAGVKYFSVGPNQGDRIGHTLSAWGDKPFWWIGPNGSDRILCWIAGLGYSNFHAGGLSRAGEAPIFAYLSKLEERKYGYDIVQIRYNTGGDNGPPDTQLPEFVKAWNEKYAYPKLVIATPSEMCDEFVKRYGDQLPKVAGDFTPYWEDGAASSARETAINREAAERLSQAEALWTMRSPGAYPADDFYAAWRNAVLYDEHTWGAFNSISEPDKPFVKEQWKIKAAFALAAGEQSKKLLRSALGGDGSGQADAIDIYNTTSFARTDMVTIPRELSGRGDIVIGPDGQAVMSQRLSTGELIFVAREVAPFSGRRYTIRSGTASTASQVEASGHTLKTGSMTVTIDPATGAIASLTTAESNVNFAASGDVKLNDYFYVPGAKPSDAKRNGPVKITVKESGPVVASLGIESDAPGCNRLAREIRVIGGLDRVDVINTVDKKAIRTKEGVHFGFAFNVPDGVIRMDIPFAVVRPEIDQIKGACKNWFTVQRWVDVSNDQLGATLATIDAPLVEVGAITADVTGGVPWLESLKPTQTVYSYVMNNYWHTNYKADQDGPTVFRYAIRPHGAYRADEASRFGISCSQPLVVAAAAGEIAATPWLKVSNPAVIVSALKPSEDGKAWIVRLFGASDKAQKTTLTFAQTPRAVYLSDLTEKQVAPLSGSLEIPAYGLVTLRAEK